MSEDIKDRFAGLVTGWPGITSAGRGDISASHIPRNDPHYLRRPDGLILPRVLWANFPRPFGAGLESLVKRLALACVPRLGLLLR